MLKKLLILAAIGLMLVSATGCSKVEAGYVGVKVYLTGGDKGVDNVVLEPGRYYIGWNEELFRFPVFQQNEVWSASPHEGKKVDESITFQSKEGMKLNADIGCSYTLDKTKVSLLFQKFRKGIDEISDVYLRNMVRNAIVEEASKRPVEQIYGEGKTDFMEAVFKRVKNEVNPIGIVLENISIIGEMRLPPEIVATLNAKLAATQKAIQAENELRTAKAEAEKKVATAEGDARATLTEAKAQAQANGMLSASLTDSLVRYKTIEKWDGRLPTVSGGATPIISMGDIMGHKGK